MSDILLDLDERIFLLTTEEVQKKIAEHRKALRIWEAILGALEEPKQDNRPVDNADSIPHKPRTTVSTDLNGSNPQPANNSSNGDHLKEAMSELGRRGGLVGGKARAEKLSPERRSEIALEAAQARWDPNFVSALDRVKTYLKENKSGTGEIISNALGLKYNTVMYALSSNPLVFTGERVGRNKYWRLVETEEMEESPKDNNKLDILGQILRFLKEKDETYLAATIAEELQINPGKVVRALEKLFDIGEVLYSGTGYYRQWRINPIEPTLDARPGSDEKVEILAKRYEEGQDLHHPRDGEGIDLR